MSVWLESLAVDRWRLSRNVNERENANPIALITNTARGPLLTALNEVAHLSGLRIGTLLADARAICPEIKTFSADPAGDLEFLEKLAVWSQRWGIWSALDPPDGLIVDVTAVGHLFGGEHDLVKDALNCFSNRGFSVKVSIAPTAGGAWALARYGSNGFILNAYETIPMQIMNLPVAALRLEVETLKVLKRLGLNTVGDLAKIERTSIRRRFRCSKNPVSNPLIRIDQLLGLVPEPLLPVIESNIPLVERRLLEPIRYRDLLNRVVHDLTIDMACELERKGEGARKLELNMWRVDNEVLGCSLELSQASREPNHIYRLFSAKLEGIDAGFGIEAVRMKASWVEPLILEQSSFDTINETHGTSFNTFIDRLTTKLGSYAVRRPLVLASHIPERAQGWKVGSDLSSASEDIMVFPPRPIKLLDNPERLTALTIAPDDHPRSFRWRGALHEVIRSEGPERISPEWWRERSTARLRDYYRVEDAKGRRYWIYRCGITGDGRGADPDWYIHGLCA